jgi:hypothetical protein
LVEEPPSEARFKPRDPPLVVVIRSMTPGERVKLALRGNRESRAILLHDVSPQIQRLVLRNPRITEQEIVALCKDRNTNEDLLSWIADDRDWMKVYAVRATLVENARTPVATALRLLATLDDADLSRLAKSKAVPNVVAVHARRLLQQRRERKN